jgi:hypothetical protein
VLPAVAAKRTVLVKPAQPAASSLQAITLVVLQLANTARRVSNGARPHVEISTSLLADAVYVNQRTRWMISSPALPGSQSPARFTSAADPAVLKAFRPATAVMAFEQLLPSGPPDPDEDSFRLPAPTVAAPKPPTAT